MDIDPALLAAGIAHEVRNPLFGITATLDALAAELGRSGELEEYLRVLRQDVDRLRRLMNDLLELGCPQPLSRQVQPLPPLLTAALADALPVAGEREVTLVTELAEPLPHLPVDGERIRQALRRLVEHAVERSPRAGKVVVAVRFVPGPPRLVAIAIADEGESLAAEDLARLCEPFHIRPRGSTGMGMAIAQQIAVHHGGGIAARNGAAGGTVVEMSLPVSLERHGSEDPAG